jgi:hypothetical protein
MPVAFVPGRLSLRQYTERRDETTAGELNALLSSIEFRKWTHGGGQPARKSLRWAATAAMLFVVVVLVAGISTLRASKDARYRHHQVRRPAVRAAWRAAAPVAEVLWRGATANQP